MELLNTFKQWFSGKKTLDRIPVDDIRKERLRLEQVEQRFTREVEDLEKRKQELFAKGKDESSQRQQILLARKIKELDAAAQAKDRQLAMISRQIRVLTGFMMLKENSQMVKEMGVSSVISSMNLDELQAYVDKATIEGQFQMERFAQLLKTMESPEGADMAGEDADTLSIVAAMQEAREAESGDPDIAVKEGIRKVDQILHQKDVNQDMTDKLV